MPEEIPPQADKCGKGAIQQEKASQGNDDATCFKHRGSPSCATHGAFVRPGLEAPPAAWRHVGRLPPPDMKAEVTKLRLSRAIAVSLCWWLPFAFLLASGAVSNERLCLPRLG